MNAIARRMSYYVEVKGLIDKQTFVSYIERESETLYRIARTMLRGEEDCKDALQESALKAWSSRHKVKEDAYFSTWFTRILINECRNIQRRQYKEQTAWVAEANLPDAPEGDAVSGAVYGLPEKFRLPLILHYVLGYSVDEVGHILRLPGSTVRGRLYQARKKLRLECGEEREVMQV